jgi:hypothetical protein
MYISLFSIPHHLYIKREEQFQGKVPCNSAPIESLFDVLSLCGYKDDVDSLVPDDLTN